MSSASLTHRSKHRLSSGSSKFESPPTKKLDGRLTPPKPVENLLSPGSNQTLNITSADQFIQFMKKALEDKGVQSILSDNLIKPIIDQYEDRIEHLEQKVALQDKLIASLQDDIEEQKQYSRRDSLRIENPWPETVPENTNKLVLNFANNILKTKLSESEISRSHRVGRPEKDENGDVKPRPILVKFIGYETRRSIYEGRTNMKDNEEAKGIFVNEDLTKTRSKMAFIGRQLKRDKKINDSWNYDGKIFIKNRKNKVMVYTSISKLLALDEELRAATGN